MRKSHQFENQITARIIKLPYQNFIQKRLFSEGGWGKRRDFFLDLFLGKRTVDSKCNMA